MAADKLIENLVSDLKPLPDRSRLAGPVLMVMVLLSSLVGASLAVSGFGSSGRSWMANLVDPAFFLALLPAVPAVLWALCLSLPGRRTGHWAALTAALFLGWGAYLVLDIWRNGEAMVVWPSRFCILDIFLLAFAPLLVLMQIIRRRFVLGADTAALALFLASSLSGAACAGIICSNHTSTHVLQEHFAPVLGALLVVFVGRRLWRRQALY